MPRLFRLLVLLLAVLFQIGLRDAAGSEPSQVRAGAVPAAPARMDAESSEDGSSERLSIDDAADEIAHRISSLAVPPWGAGIYTPASGLARRLLALDTPFEPPRWTSI